MQAFIAKKYKERYKTTGIKMRVPVCIFGLHKGPSDNVKSGAYTIC